MLIQADAFHLPCANNLFHACVTSPPYWGLRAYSGKQGDEPLGLEEDYQDYVDRLVVACREVHRVLRDDGVFWLNLGDCYTGGGRGGQSAEKRSTHWQPEYRRVNAKNYPQGSLMLIPHRVAIALQDDGWMLRNDNVWWKRNPMPDPVAGWRWENDNLRKSSWRYTRAHEYVFQLVKKMGYYCNQEAVREPYTKPLDRWGGNAKSMKDMFKGDEENKMRGLHRERDMRPHEGGRNPRTVLDVPTTSYSGAHYAVFPPKLITPFIKASVPARACPECGQGHAPVVEKGEPEFGQSSWGLEGRRHFKMDVGEMVETSLEEGSTLKHDIPRTVTGYRPTCECGREDYVPGIVLDPFGGSGTTGMVAKQLMRRWVVMDISMPYIDEQAKVRTGEGTPSIGLTGLPLFDGLPK